MLFRLPEGMLLLCSPAAVFCSCPVQAVVVQNFLCSRTGVRSKGKALTRALKLVDEGDAEIANLSTQASKLDLASAETKARINELEVRMLGV